MKKLQDKVKEFCERHNLICPLEFRFLDLVSELGEFAKEIIRATNYGKKEFKFRQEIKNEIGDLLFSLIVLANQLNLDLEQALNLVLEKYGKRIKEKRSPSSTKV
jgi:NTP pyrophosphatase (non-canonical NTP hydrolase)